MNNVHGAFTSSSIPTRRMKSIHPIMYPHTCFQPCGGNNVSLSASRHDIRVIFGDTGCIDTKNNGQTSSSFDNIFYSQRCQSKFGVNSQMILYGVSDDSLDLSITTSDLATATSSTEASSSISSSSSSKQMLSSQSREQSPTHLQIDSQNARIKNNDKINNSNIDLDESASESTTAATANAILLLNLVAILWGTQHALIKTVVDDTRVDTSAFTTARFALGAILASPYTPGIDRLRKLFYVNENLQEIEKDGTDIFIEEKNDLLAWKWGLEMGLWMFLGYAFQAVGLEFTSASRSGFLLYLNVKFVPFFSKILFNRSISIPTWISALTAFIGTALLSYHVDDGSTSGTLALNVGDIWTIFAAMASAMFILRLETASSKVSNSSKLNSASLWTVTAFSSFWVFGEGIHDALTSFPINSPTPMDFNGLANICTMATQSTFQKLQEILVYHPVEIIYLGGVTTALANYVQARAQKVISAERASVIYAMDPVYGMIFSYFLLKETLSDSGFLGAGLITFAAATNAFLDLGSRDDVEVNDNEDAAMQ